MYEIKKHNYKVTLEYGNGHDETFNVIGLTGVFQQCRDKASKKGTTMLHAKVYPISVRGNLVTGRKILLLDTLGTYHYHEKGDRIPFGRI